MSNPVAKITPKRRSSVSAVVNANKSPPSTSAGSMPVFQFRRYHEAFAENTEQQPPVPSSPKGSSLSSSGSFSFGASSSPRKNASSRVLETVGEDEGDTTPESPKTATSPAVESLKNGGSPLVSSLL
jgi:hypothetical protein